jgi:hypothetical protein
MTTRIGRSLMIAVVASVIAGPAHAQLGAYTFDKIESSLRARVRPSHILDGVARDCIDFPMTPSVRTRLRVAGADDAFLAALETACYAGPLLDVVTDPPGATIVLGNDTLGRSPGTFQVFAAQMARLRLIGPAGTRTADVQFVAGTRTTVNAEMKADTAPVPAIRDAERIVLDLGLVSRYPPAGPAPVAPEAPSLRSAPSSFAWGGILVGAISALAGATLCNPSRTADVDGYVGGQAVLAGQSYTESLGPGCTGGIAAAGVIAGGALNAIVAGNANRGRLQRHKAAVAAFPAQQREWEAKVAERERAIATDSLVVAARTADERAARTQRERNAQIALRNAKLGPVDIVNAPLDGVAAVAAAPPVQNDGASAAGRVGPGALLANVPRGGRVNRNAVAVIIGNRTYKDPLIPPVDYAENDALAVREHLEKTFGFQPENIIFERNAGLSKLQTIFGTKDKFDGSLAGRLDKSSDLFIFYSGHGAPDAAGRAYLVPEDGNPQSLELTGYPLDVLYDNVAKLPFRSVTVALDACFSGTTERGSMMRGTSAMQLRVRNPLLTAENATVLAASAPDQVAFWYDEMRHGMFTYFLVSRLRELAQATPDPAVRTGQALGEYLEQAVSRQVRRSKAGRDQRPQVAGKAAEKPLAIFAPQ